MRPLIPLLACLAPLAACAATSTELVADGFERPIYLDAPSHDKQRLWIVEQGGAVWIIDRSTGERISDKPFLDLRGKVNRKGNEQGLLGLAFAPDFGETGRFYINYTDLEDTSHVARLVATGPDFLSADAEKREILFSYEQPFNNHNGGWLGFGPDGMLYIPTGDGGAAFDPKNNAQDPTNLLGKILRIDVSTPTGYKIPEGNPFADGKDGRPEILSIGLRNPWRCAFDRKTGDFWIADVGQNLWEEINVVPFDKLAGANFGWRLREGDIATPSPTKTDRGVTKGEEIGGEPPAAHVEPVYVYKHGTKPEEGLSVTGGYVYRGPVEEFRGRYLFADYQNQRVWSFVPTESGTSDFRDHSDAFKPAGHAEGAPLGLIMSFGEDPAGDLYILTFDGRILKIVD